MSQKIKTCLSLSRGESPFHRDYGARLAEYYHAYNTSPLRGAFLKLEVIRQAAIPYHDNIQNQEYTPLQCVERVWGIELLAGAPENRWLPMRFDFDVAGVGRMQFYISVLIPPQSELLLLRNKGAWAGSGGLPSLPQSPLRPDWSIRELFLHICPGVPEKTELWDSVGRNVLDKFSTGELKVWGRRIESSRRLALTDIPADQWQRAKFTYWFLKEPDGQSLDVTCDQATRGSAPLQYADLQVNQAQALTVFPAGAAQSP